jgi:fucose 4-O-acetylase-like acetyltransferase
MERSAAAARRTDLDLLRILICAAVILAHALLIFAAEPRYHVKSAEPSPGASVLYEFLRITTMPAFFTMAGWAAVVSLRRRGVARFVRERGERVFLPLVVGVVLLGPVIKFIELGQGRDLRMDGFRLVTPLRLDFLTFLPLYFHRLNLLTWSHLWFLAYLFVLSLLLLPLLAWLAAREPSARMPHPAWAYAPALPLVLVLVGCRGYWPFYPSPCSDWANFSYFGLCFGFGAVLAVWPGFETRLTTEAPRLLLLALAAFAGVVLCGESAAGRLFVALTAWGFTAAALGYAGRYRPAQSRLLTYLSEATLPVYIVHHVPVLLLGVAIVPLALPVGVRIVLIWLSATAVSLAGYHWLIRPWRLTRYLTGMHAAANSVTLVSPAAARLRRGANSAGCGASAAAVGSASLTGAAAGRRGSL